MVSIGNCFINDIEEWPVPKSSMAMRMPRLWMASSTRMARATLRITMLSVTSSCSSTGDMPLASSASSTSCSKWGSANWRGERFTAIDTGRRPRRCQAMFCAQASFSTQRPIGTISVAALAGLLQDDNEFVAAEPRHRVAGAQRATQPVRHLHQQHVAGLAAERVVDDLEAVEIDEQQREFARMALRGLDGMAQQAVEHLAVGQP